MGATHIRLAEANEDLLAGALRTAWKLRLEKNAKAGGKKRSSGATRGLDPGPGETHPQAHLKHQTADGGARFR
jgi:hypothetical protein